MKGASIHGDGPPHANGNSHGTARILSSVPAELTEAPLRRLGEGIGKVVYASRRWVVKRERSPSEIIALIWIWKTIRRIERILPGKLGRRLLERPSKSIRLLRIVSQAFVPIVPRGLWFATHTREIWKTYHFRERRGERLAHAYLSGTSLIPETITFPPACIQVAGWPGWLTVSEATERVEDTLHRRLALLASEQRFDELELWLNRFLDLRQSGWRHGVFSVDAHLKNFGVTEGRVVLLDAGGLTDRWEDIEERLARDRSMPEPHVALGLGPVLRTRPDIAERFDARWRATVTLDQVRSLWPSSAGAVAIQDERGGKANKVA